VPWRGAERVNAQPQPINWQPRQPIYYPGAP
jgi:hypothetical protein